MLTIKSVVISSLGRGLGALDYGIVKTLVESALLQLRLYTNRLTVLYGRTKGIRVGLGNMYS